MMNLLAGLHFLIENRVPWCFHVLLIYYYTWLVIAEESLPSRSTCWCWHLGTVDMGCICAGPAAKLCTCAWTCLALWALFRPPGVQHSKLAVPLRSFGWWAWASPVAKKCLQVHIFCNITQDQLALFWKVRIGISCAVTYMLWKAWPVISFIGKKLASDNTKMRHRHEFCTCGRAGLYGVACNHCQENCIGSFLIIQHGHMEGCLALSLLDPSQIKRSWCGLWWAGRGDTGLEVVDLSQILHMLKPFASCFS